MEGLFVRACIWFAWAVITDWELLSSRGCTQQSRLDKEGEWIKVLICFICNCLIWAALLWGDNCHWLTMEVCLAGFWGSGEDWHSGNSLYNLMVEKADLSPWLQSSTTTAKGFFCKFCIRANFVQDFLLFRLNCVSCVLYCSKVFPPLHCQQLGESSLGVLWPLDSGRL